MDLEQEVEQIRRRDRSRELKLRILQWAPRTDDTEGYIYTRASDFSSEAIYDASLSLAASGMIEGLRIDTGPSFAVRRITPRGLEFLEHLQQSMSSS